MKSKRKYSDESKRETAAMVLEQDRSVRDVCGSLSIGSTALRRWICNQQNNPGGAVRGKPTLSTDQQHIHALEKKVKTLQKERDI